MIIGFIIWSAVAVIFIIIGIVSWRAKKPVGFFTGVKAPVVSDAIKYNHSVGTLWLVYAVLLELLGIPFLYLEQNSAGFIIPYLGVVVITIGLVVAYSIIASKYKKI